MRSESPMRIDECSKRPSPPGIGERLNSAAPNAFLQNSSACAALRQTRCGVTVCIPSGIGFTAAITTSLALRDEFGYSPARPEFRGGGRGNYYALWGGNGTVGFGRRQCVATLKN